MAELRAAYLIHGDDHGGVSERRAGLRALGERVGSVELLEGDAATPALAAQALATMTLAVGRRVIIIDGVERWKDSDVEQHLQAAMGDMPPETTLAFFAREEQRAKAPAALHRAVERAGGQVVAQMNVRRSELPRWVREQSARLGLSLDAGACRALVVQVGERQQRLLRELEKLALEADGGDLTAAGREVGAAEIEQRASRSAELQAFRLADSLVGADRRDATLAYLRLRHQGERLAGLTYLMARRLRDALAASIRLQAGESVASVKRGVGMPPRVAERFLADVARTDPDRLRHAISALAMLEVDSRGGSPVSSTRSPTAALSEDTIAQRAIEALTA